MERGTDSFSLQQLHHISGPLRDEWPAVTRVQPEWPAGHPMAKGEEIEQE